MVLFCALMLNYINIYHLEDRMRMLLLQLGCKKNLFFNIVSLLSLLSHLFSIFSFLKHSLTFHTSFRFSSLTLSSPSLSLF